LKKHYVLDTNVLLYSPQAIFAFSEHTVIIPEVVLEELDKFKSESTERGAHSRQVSRIIDELRYQGNLLNGVPLNEQGGILRIETNCLEISLPPHWDRAKPDNRILQVCKGLADNGHYTVLVSRDTNLRVKAAILDIHAEDFRNDKVAAIEDQYTGRTIVYTSSETINKFHADDGNAIDPALLSEYDENDHRLKPASFVTNQFMLIRSTDNDRHTALARFDGEKAVHLKYRNRNPFGVTPRNIGQVFMQECLMMNADEAPLVIIKGPAGTAKTFYSLAVGLYKYTSTWTAGRANTTICSSAGPISRWTRISVFCRGRRTRRSAPTCAGCGTICSLLCRGI
jgi:PhoH-like ATPase